MSTFKLTNYQTPDEQAVKVDESDNPINETSEKVAKEIKISEMGGDTLSTTVALTLLNALKQDNLDLIKIDEPKNNALKDVRIVTADDINVDPVKSYQFANEAHAIIMDMKSGFNSLNERIFISNVKKDVKIFYNVESFIGRKAIHDFVIESHLATQTAEVLTNVNNEEALLLTNFELGDIVDVNGKLLKICAVNGNHIAMKSIVEGSEEVFMYDYLVRKTTELPE